jgi:hypothetical protein
VLLAGKNATHRRIEGERGRPDLVDSDSIFPPFSEPTVGCGGRGRWFGLSLGSMAFIIDTVDSDIYKRTEYSSDLEEYNDVSDLEAEAVQAVDFQERSIRPQGPCAGGAFGLRGLGLTERLLCALRYRDLRSLCLKHFISTDGCCTIEDLRHRVRLTRRRSPAAPSWYKYGAFRVGLYRCTTSGCPAAETEASGPFSVCSGCRRVHYCSATCQRADWNARHKVMCKKAALVRQAEKAFVGSALRLLETGAASHPDLVPSVRQSFALMTQFLTPEMCQTMIDAAAAAHTKNLCLLMK